MRQKYTKIRHSKNVFTVALIFISRAWENQFFYLILHFRSYKQESNEYVIETNQ